MPPTSVAIVEHGPLICAGCGGTMTRSVVVPPGGPGSLTICTGCGAAVHLEGPIWATRAHTLNPRIMPEVAALRIGFARAGIQLPSGPCASDVLQRQGAAP